jgi:hypothetical protein
MGIQANVNSGNRLIMLHVGGINGFVPNAQLVYKAGSATGNYHGQMNSANFENWVVKKLVPNLSPHAVIVLDNAPYHCIQVDKPPLAYALESDMISWLHNKGVNCNATMCAGIAFTNSDSRFVISEIIPDDQQCNRASNSKDWKGFCQHMESLEKQYWEKDGIVTNVIDNIIVSFICDSDRDSQNESEGSTSSGEYSD